MYMCSSQLTCLRVHAYYHSCWWYVISVTNINVLVKCKVVFTLCRYQYIVQNTCTRVSMYIIYSTSTCTPQVIHAKTFTSAPVHTKYSTICTLHVRMHTCICHNISTRTSQQPHFFVVQFMKRDLNDTIQ